MQSKFFVTAAVLTLGEIRGKIIGRTIIKTYKTLE